MKFVISYSCGKDSTLALHKTIAAGHEPVGLIVMYNEGADRSWFHGVDPRLLDRIAEPGAGSTACGVSCFRGEIPPGTGGEAQICRGHWR